MKLLAFFVLLVAFCFAELPDQEIIPSPAQGKENALTLMPIITKAPNLVGAVNTLAATAEYSIESHRTNTWTRIPVMTAFNTACFLTYTEYQTRATAAHYGCEVYFDQATTFWFLYAFSDLNTDTYCKARCIQWS